VGSRLNPKNWNQDQKVETKTRKLRLRPENWGQYQKVERKTNWFKTKIGELKPIPESWDQDQWVQNQNMKVERRKFGELKPIPESWDKDQRVRTKTGKLRTRPAGRRPWLENSDQDEQSQCQLIIEPYLTCQHHYSRIAGIINFYKMDFQILPRHTAHDTLLKTHCSRIGHGTPRYSGENY